MASIRCLDTSGDPRPSHANRCGVGNIAYVLAYLVRVHFGLRDLSPLPAMTRPLILWRHLLPSRWILTSTLRVGTVCFWAFLLGVLPITLVYLGGLEPLKSAVTLVSVPLYAVIVLLTLSMWKSIKQAEKDQALAFWLRKLEKC